MDFSSGLKSGMSLGIGEAMGPQQSPMVAQIIKQKMASDMQAQKEAIMANAKAGFGVNITEKGVSVNPLYDNAPPEVKMLAINNASKNFMDAIEKQATVAAGGIEKAMGLLKNIDEFKDLAMKKSAGVLFNQLFTREEFGGAPNPLRIVGDALGEQGLNVDEIIRDQQKRKEVFDQNAVVLMSKYVEAIRAGDVEKAANLFPVLSGMNVYDSDAMGKVGFDPKRDMADIQQQFMSQAQKEAVKTREAASQDAKDRSVQRLLRANPNMTEAEAINWVEGRTKTAIAQETGDASLVDVGKGTQTPFRTVFPGDEPDAPEGPKISEKELSDINLFELAEKGTGLISSVKAGLSTVSGLARGPIAEKTEYARQALSMAQRNLFRALRESSRVLAYEMKQILEEYPIDPSIVRSPEQAKVNYIAIDNFLDERISEAEAKEKDLGVPAKERGEARSLIRSMKDFKKILGVPPRYSPETYKKLKKGQQYLDADWNVRIKGDKKASDEAPKTEHLDRPSDIQSIFDNLGIKDE